MTNTSETKWIAVDIETFRGVTRDISFDVYLKLSEDNLAHVFSRSTGLDYKRLANYMNKGVRELFVKAEDFPAYQAFISRPAAVILDDPSVPQEKKIATLLNLTEQNMAEVFSQFTIREETAESSRAIVRNYVELMASQPNTLALILKLVSHGEYLYYHSIAVSIFSLFIAKATGKFDKRTLELIGMGGFLHDIGCTQIPRAVTESPVELTNEQWAEMREHTRLGMAMVTGSNLIPEEVRYIIYQHHERPSGMGYPNALQNTAIYYPAKVVAVADAFSALISKRPFRPAYSVEEAIRILEQEQEQGKFDGHLVSIVKSIFLLRQGKAAA